MPRRTIHVRKSDVETFDRIEDRPDWLHYIISRYKGPLSDIKVKEVKVKKTTYPPDPLTQTHVVERILDEPLRHIPQLEAISERREEHYKVTKQSAGPNGMEAPPPPVRSDAEDYFPDKETYVPIDEMP